MSQSQTTPRSFGQFSLQSLLAAILFAALGLWAWRGSGFIGLTSFVTFVSIVAGNLGIALLGAKFGYPFLAGAVGGAVLWSIATACTTVTERLAWYGGYPWFEDPWAVATVGVLAGLVCGGYGKITVKQERQVPRRLRKALIYYLAATALLGVWLGWKLEQARQQRNLVGWVEQSGGRIRYDYEVNRDGNRAHIGPPGPGWLREHLGIDFFDEVVSVSKRVSSNDVSALAKLKSLESLYLTGPQLSDVSSLANLTRLETVGLSGTQVSDLTPLTGLSALSRLDLTGTAVTDISPLASLSRLEWLDISGTRVRDVTPLASLSRLQSLNLGSTPVTDVSSLGDCDSLVGLNLKACRQLSNVSGLGNCASLQTIHLSGCGQLSDVSGLGGCDSLVRLWLEGCGQLTDVSGLGNCASLQFIDLSRCTQLSDVSGLSGSRSLQTLWMIGCDQLTEVSGLGDCDTLERLNLSQCRQLSDLSGLEKCASLRFLGLTGCKRLTDVSPLAQLRELEYLSLHDTAVSLEALEELQAALPTCKISH